MLIKSATLEDVPALSQLATQSFTETFGHFYPTEDLEAFITQSYHPEKLSALVADPKQFWRIIWDDDKAAAYLQCSTVHLPHADTQPGQEGEINRLYVHSAYQGHGLGRRLMTEAFAWLAENFGTAPQWLGVKADNLKAQALYGSYGFVKVGEYKFPVGNTLDDEFIFRRQP